ncbi:hypothetical protein [Methylococcus geothermalis]|uniref:PilZ domain-containing protein n=1 Tax=Methylococcus geothermalis TaxID=2681310 RepID=A0A858Q9D3_9GAMM|nr:hypothetical protein [Methylococcus geothermalis]QJD30457.1 hypothetical protein GNH96_11035 [Methylococcus geothermalis]
MAQAHAARRELRLACRLELPGSSTITGNTRDLSPQDVSLQSAALLTPGPRRPKPGDRGILTLIIRGPGLPNALLKIPCRVTFINGNMLHLQITTAGLDTRQQETFDLLFKR